jgi:hypothetical protein
MTIVEDHRDGLAVNHQTILFRDLQFGLSTAGLFRFLRSSYAVAQMSNHCAYVEAMRFLHQQ